MMNSNTSKWCPKIVVAAFWTLSTGGSFALPARSQPPVQVREVRPLVQYVDPMIGVRGAGQNVPGPQIPFGSVNPSPDTPNATCGGYSPSQPIRGFRAC